MPDPALEQAPLPRDFTLRRFVRRNLLLSVATALFVGLIIVFMVQIDRVYYSNAKSALMDRNSEVPKSGELTELLNTTLYDNPAYERLLSIIGDWPEPRNRIPPPGPDAPEREVRAYEREQIRIREIEQEAQELLEKVFAENPIILSFSLEDTNSNVIAAVADPGRMAEQNTFENSLFIRSWEKQVTRGNTIERGGTREIRSIVYRYTTPKGIPDIQELTTRWRVRSLLVLSGMLLLFAGLMWALILPVRNVMTALDKGNAIGARFLIKAPTLLEKYYNNLARDATLSILATRLRAFLTERSLIDPAPLIHFAPPLVAELFPFQTVAVLTLRRSDEADAGSLDVWESGGIAPLGRKQAEEMAAVLGGLSLPGVDSDENGHLECDAHIRCMARLLLDEQLQRVALVAAVSEKQQPLEEWWQDVFRRIAREIRFALQTVEEQRRLIFQEKNKANISLSRNLGHDLTNIIATSKLELMTVRSLLGMPQEKIYSSEKKQRIFRESLESLLNSTRFLQETVNLYRSFTYLSRPKFEEVRLAELAEEVAGLFRLSISSNIDIHTHAEEGLEPITVEPRLMKLALFNLLSNAADAIKLQSTAERPTGEITIRVGRGKGPTRQMLTIEDSGGGICGHDGHLLSPNEIEKVFQLGYTTKEQGTGEGLGLNWVFQIVREFHGGEIHARNRPEGGAAFSIILAADTLKDIADTAAAATDSGEIRTPPEEIPQ